MRRWLLVRLGLLLAFGAVAFVTSWALGGKPAEGLAALAAGPPPPIVVGLLHSQTGPLAISEKSLVNAEVLAIEEINARGGLGGRKVEYREVDGRSDPTTFTAEARRLIESERAVALFGTYTSECRKAVRAVVEEKSGLLFAPGNCEGMERSPRLVYAGGSANQSVTPAVRWATIALKARRFFVAGSEEVWSRSVAEIAKDAVKAYGAELAGESYLPMDGSDVDALVRSIRDSKADVVLSSILGDSNLPFYAALRRAGLAPEKLPVVSWSIAEDELRRMPPGDVAGHFSAWNYFQSVDRAENRDFIRRFKARFGADRVTSDALVSAYNAVMLWAGAVDELGSAEPGPVADHLGRQSLDAPDSVVTLDPESRVFWRPFHVGRARLDGQFDVLWSITKPIRPLTYAPTRSREQWDAFLDGLKAGWGGHWSSTAATKPAATPGTPK